MAANLASSSSRRISFIAITRPVVLPEPPVLVRERLSGDSGRRGVVGEVMVEEEDEEVVVGRDGATLPLRPRPGRRIRGRLCRTW